MIDGLGVTYAPGTDTIGGSPAGTATGRLRPQEAIRVLNLRLPKRGADVRGGIAPAALLSGAGSGAPSVAGAGGMQAVLRALAQAFGQPNEQQGAGWRGESRPSLSGPAPAPVQPVTTPRFAAPPPHVIAGGGGRYPGANQDEWSAPAPLFGDPTPPLTRAPVTDRSMPIDANAPPLDLPAWLRYRGGGPEIPGPSIPHLGIPGR